MKKILPLILDSNFNMIGTIDTYKSLIWTTRYYVHGDFEITVGLTPQVMSLIKIGNYVIRDDDDNVGIIEKVDLKITETNEQRLIISGRFLTQILGRRIIAEQTQVSDTVSAAIYQLITDAIINPAIEDRKINNFILASFETSETIEAQYTGKNLYTVISDICLQYGLGFKITLNDSNQFVFSLYKGVDRSYDQETNPYIVFSDQYDNLINAEYQNDAKNLVTAVLAAGEGEGIDRKIVWVTSEANPTGLLRYEFYDDSRNTSSNSGEIPEEEYLNQLAELGRANLTTYESTFGGEANFSGINYKTDVNIGDIVTIENTRLGIALNARIIEIIESIDASGKYSIIPTFGS